MKTQDQIKALAELDGWLDIKEYTYDYDFAGERGKFQQWQGREPSMLGKLQALKPYLTSYDAIISLVQKQDIETRRDVYRQLHRDKFQEETETTSRFTVDIGNFIEFTPAQLCEALLRATGKWKN